MIKEVYCSYEVSKLLKEKGFHEPCIATYNSTTKKFYVEELYLDWSTQWESYISVPTHQMAMAWLREVHNIQIELNWDKGNQLYSFQIWKLGKYQPEISSLDLWRIYKDDNYLGEWNYEDAVETALKYVLKNLI